MAIKKIRMKPPGYTDIVYPETSADIVIEDANHRFVTDSEKGIWNAKQAAVTGGASTIVSSNLTINRALVSDASGKVAVSAVTSTELGYLTGVTSAIQTQLNGKSAISHNHTLDSLSNTTITSNTNGEILRWNGTAWINNTLAEAGIQPSITGGATTIASSNLTASRALVSDASGKVAVSAVTSTELGYLSGATGNIQTQINLKVERNNDVGSGVGVGTLTIADANLLQGFPASTFARQSDFASADAKLGLGGIVESGSNANGRYVKYNDGTMFCHARRTTGNVTIATGSSFRSSTHNWTFPVAFIEAPTVSIQVDAGIAFGWGALGADGVNASSCSYSAYSSNNAPTTAAVSIMVVGRWK